MTRVLFARVAVVAAGVGALAAGGSADAHHSYAMFDRARVASVDGTVAKFEWTNPHTYLWAYVGQAGKYDRFLFESGGPGMLARAGWRKDSLLAGEKIRVDYFPLKDGRPGGYLIRVKKSDGRILGGDDVASQQLPGESRPPPQPKD